MCNVQLYFRENEYSEGFILYFVYLYFEISDIYFAYLYFEISAI